MNSWIRCANGHTNENVAAAASADRCSSDTEWDGCSDTEPGPRIEAMHIDREDEYIDEEKYTTVTVEMVGISREGFTKDDEGGSEVDCGRDQPAEKREWSKEKPKRAQPKQKKKKFRYESKADRRTTQLKERAKSKRHAARRRG